MTVLVACEESQVVCKAFRDAGHEAFSCDLQPTRGNPVWHIQGDALIQAYTGDWDMMIAHPPCTYMSKAGARWMHSGGIVNEARYALALEAKDFFLALMNAPIRKICIENPTPLKIVGLPPHSQAVQPYEYGDPYSKRTLLWLKNLPLLVPTDIVDYTPYMPSNTGGKKRGQSYTYRGISKRASSQTFQGIAQAMASQW